jgi:hypothetical protein
VALFTLHVTAANGNVPPDTTLRVRWSAGEEPLFVLSDPSTWGSVHEGANVECVVDRDASVPADLEELVCDLWTVGATDIEVSAAGYITAEETLTPAQREECDGPVPSDVDIKLEPDQDAGN